MNRAVWMPLGMAVVSSALIQHNVPDAFTCAGGVLILLSALLEAMRPAARSVAPGESPAPVA